jgi:hypothetical protein
VTPYLEWYPGSAGSNTNAQVSQSGEGVPHTLLSCCLDGVGTMSRPLSYSFVPHIFPTVCPTFCPILCPPGLSLSSFPQVSHIFFTQVRPTVGPQSGPQGSLTGLSPSLSHSLSHEVTVLSHRFVPQFVPYFVPQACPSVRFHRSVTQVCHTGSSHSWSIVWPTG